jgi:hypothetical protein
MPETQAAVERLLNAIDRAEESSYGSDEKGALASDRALAIKHYLGKNLNPAPEGRSQVIDRSVFETINWILPSLVDIFANGDDVISMPPVGPEDEEGAKQEAQYLNHIALNKLPWLEICLSLFVDSMLTKNAYVYVYREYKRNVEIEAYERQTKESLQLLLEDKDVEVIEHKEYPDPDGQMEPVMGPDGPQLQVVAVDPMGQPVMEPAMQPVMLYDVTIRRTEMYGNYCIDVLPPERCKVSDQTPTFRLKECPYFEYWAETTISDLRKQGFEVADDISDAGQDDTEEDLARDQYNESNEDSYAADPAMRRVKVRTIWVQHDFDEDGIAEMQRCIVVGRELLKREEVGRIHVASTVPIPLPHRHIGLSIADIVRDLQDIKTAILRQGLDNLYLSNNGRNAISNKVNIEDALLSRPGQPIRVDSDAADVAGHVVPVVAPFIFPQAMEGLEYMDQIKENRTGTSRYFTGIDQNALNKTATGIQQLTTMAAQRVKLMARILGMCMEDIFSILHEVILKSGHKKETVQLRGKWVDVDPAAWKKRKDFKTIVGYAAGNKDALLQKLLLLATKQGEAAAGGLRIVNEQNMYETGVELTKALDLAVPDRFWTDPATLDPPAPPQPDVTVMAAEGLKAQTTEKVKAAELQSEERIKAAEIEFEKYKATLDAQTKITVTEMQQQHASQMEMVKGNQAVGLEHHKAALNPKTKEADAKKSEVQQKDTMIESFMQSQERQTQAISAMFEQVLKAVQSMNGPKEIVRGKDGRAMGVRPMNGNGAA